jgi:hypothetical protein
MAGLGRFAGPITIGGDVSPAEAVWRALRSAEGTHVGAEGSIEDDYRSCIAGALAAADVAVERAALQFLPLHADDLLERYEDVLGILPAPSLTRTERREQAATEWHRRGRADLPSLEEELQDRFGGAWTIEHVDVVVSTLPGRRLSPVGLEATEPRKYPNWSNAYAVRARADGLAFDLATVRAVRAWLDDRIPAWCLAVVVYGAGPYIVDGTMPLDVTPLGDP